MVAVPSGTVTFLFTDVEGSTAHWEQRPDVMRTALEMHDAILQAVMGERGGAVFATGGDGFAVAFGRAEAAVSAAIGAQRRLAAQMWPDGLALKVRMGLHTGEAHERDGDYFGPAVNRAARVMDAANRSQILLSAATREVVRDGVTQPSVLVDLGVHELRDVVDPMRLYRLEDPAFDSDRRPPRTGSVRAGNLAAASGTLFGRADDIDSVIDDLASARVVTLTGVGGIGKTQLALEIGRHQQPQRRDGVWFAALDTIDRPELMARALLGLLGIEPRAERDLDSLVEGLRFRDTLLVLDNCGHLLDAAAEITSAVVAECPNARCSRHRGSPSTWMVSAHGAFGPSPPRMTDLRSLSSCNVPTKREPPSTPRVMPTPSSGSAAASTASHSPSSWPPRGRARFVQRRSRIDWTTCSTC